MSNPPVYKKKDFISDQEVRWCPGCGDYAILAAVQMAMTKIGKKKDDIVFVSGIGCSSRFPYYMNTYGLHTIHGRANAVASGIKLANPNLEVWVATGDGDSLSIGGNHLIHILRRNIDINVILFNNEIYGLTKGQYSPSSKPGIITRSTPYGSIERNFNPALLCLGAGSTFFARTIDTDTKHMTDVFTKASKHKGTSMVEVLQNCLIFNDGAHAIHTNRDIREDNIIRLKDGQPMIFGRDKDKGLRLNGFKPEIVTLGEDGITEDDLIVHDKENDFSANMLGNLRCPDFPLPIGVLKEVFDDSVEDKMQEQIDIITNEKGEGDMQSILDSGDVWEVTKE